MDDRSSNDLAKPSDEQQQLLLLRRGAGKLTRRDALAAGLGAVGLAALGVGAGFVSKRVFPQRLVYEFPDAGSARAGTQLARAAACGLGVTAAAAAIGGDVAALRAAVLALFVASALTPPVVIYNIGAFNQTDPTGWRAFGLAGGVILGVSLPLLLSLRVLGRMRRTAGGGCKG